MNSACAFLFPGQGSQAVGMGQSLAAASQAARDRFEEADAILGRFLSKMCLDGPEELLKETENTQPALFVCSVLAADALRERDILPAACAGHSLGEYSALYAAGVLDFETGLRLVAARGTAMAEAGRRTPGAMAAVLGLAVEQVEAVCAQASSGESCVVVANDNSPGQTVISGAAEAVERACALAREAGAKRALPLPVSGAFHSPLVAEARCVMEAALAQAVLHPPNCLFLPNVTAAPESDPVRIRALLVEQITSRVRWVDTVRALVSDGLSTALEAGPGKVLAGLVKRTEPGLTVHPAGSAEEIAALEGLLQQESPTQDS